MDDLEVEALLVPLKLAVAGAVDAIGSVEDDVSREMEAREVSKALQFGQVRLRRVRGQAVREWRAGGRGRSMVKTAREFGLHRKTIQELLRR